MLKKKSSNCHYVTLHLWLAEKELKELNYLGDQETLKSKLRIKSDIHRWQILLL